MTSQTDPTGVDIEDGIDFIRHESTGAVHVAVADGDLEVWWSKYRRTHPLAETLYPDVPAMWLFIQPRPCLCGLLALRPAMGDTDSYVECFDDDDLCGSCYKAFQGPPELLFEHEHPTELGDDE